MPAFSCYRLREGVDCTSLEEHELSGSRLTVFTAVFPQMAISKCDIPAPLNCR